MCCWAGPTVSPWTTSRTDSTGVTPFSTIYRWEVVMFRLKGPRLPRYKVERRPKFPYHLHAIAQRTGFYPDGNWVPLFDVGSQFCKVEIFSF